MKSWIRPLALAVAALFLAIGLYVVSVVIAGVLFAVAFGCTIWAIGMAANLVRPRDRYSLNELRRVHEEEELRELDPDDALGEPEKVVCLRCGNQYPFRLGACPRCGLSA